MMIEFRICWAANSNISFSGESDWMPTGEGETAAEVEESLTRRNGSVEEALNIALEASGFEWWIETREGNA